MRNVIEGFNQSVLIHLGLGPNEAVVLRWLLSFIHSGKEKFIDRNSNRYYWVDYRKVVTDLPCLFIHNSKVVGRLFDKLCGTKSNKRSKINNYPLIKLRVRVGGIQRTYFCFDPKVLSQLEEHKMDKLIELDSKPINEKLKRKHPLHPEVQSILEELLTIKNEDKKLFTNTLPQDRLHYTKGIEQFQAKLMSLYTGRFSSEYKLSEAFKKKNEQHLEGYAKRIAVCKCSWASIEQLLLMAAKNYRSWFDPNREPQTKAWLPRCVSNWMHWDGASVFLACLDGKAFPMRELTAEKIFNGIEVEIRDAALELLKDNFDSVNFWRRIKSVSDWYDEYARELSAEDDNVSWWLEGGKAHWFRAYAAWLVELAGSREDLFLKHFGTGCPTWRLWCAQSAKKHNISVVLPDA